MSNYTNKNLDGVKGKVTYANDKLSHVVLEKSPPLKSARYAQGACGDTIVYKDAYSKELATVIDAGDTRVFTAKQREILSRPANALKTRDEYGRSDIKEPTYYIAIRGSAENRSMSSLEELGLIKIHDNAITATIKGRMNGVGLNLSLMGVQNCIRFFGQSKLTNEFNAQRTWAEMELTMFLDYVINCEDCAKGFNCNISQLQELAKNSPTIDDVLAGYNQKISDLKIENSRQAMRTSDLAHRNYRLSNRIGEFVDMLKGEGDHNFAVAWDTKTMKSWLDLDFAQEIFDEMNQFTTGGTVITTTNPNAQ